MNKQEQLSTIIPTVTLLQIGLGHGATVLELGATVMELGATVLELKSEGARTPEQPVQEPGAGVRVEALQRQTRPRHGSVHLEEDAE